MYHVWGMLGWQDIKQRYRRSVLGPWWLTIASGIMIGAMGYLYARLLGQATPDYMPFLAVGFILWNFVATAVTEGCTVFIAAEGIVKQVKLPLTLHVCRVLWRNVIVFAHNAVIILLTLLFFGKSLVWPGVVALAGFALIILNGLWVVALLGIFCARFRDIPPIVASVLQILFFMTPIMWDKSMLGARGWFADINPVFHLIEVMRAPLLGTGIPYVSFAIVLVMGAAGAALTLYAMTRFRARVPYWL